MLWEFVCHLVRQIKMINAIKSLRHLHHAKSDRGSWIKWVEKKFFIAHVANAVPVLDVRYRFGKFLLARK